MLKEEIKAIDQIVRLSPDRSYASLKQITWTCSFIDFYFRTPRHLGGSEE